VLNQAITGTLLRLNPLLGSDAEVARRIGVTRSAATKFKNGDALPSLRVAWRLSRLASTEGLDLIADCFSAEGKRTLIVPTRFEHPLDGASCDEVSDIAEALGAETGDDPEVDAFLAEVDEVVAEARELALAADADLADQVEAASTEDQVEDAEDALRRAALELLSVPGEVPGQEIYFVLYVDNTTAFPALDLRLDDAIDETQFTYVDESLETTSVPTGSNDAAIWAGTWAGLTDGAADDEASAGDSGGPAGRDRITVGAVPSQSNAQVDLSGQTLMAVRFRVTVN